MLRKSLILFALVVLLFSACKDDDPFVNVTYMCECGSTNWNGSTHLLTDAHWVITDTTVNDIGFPEITGKDYYSTAKIELDEVEPHHYNMKLSVPDLTQGIQAFLGSPRFFYAHPDSNDVEFLIEEVNFNSLAEVTEYKVLDGEFTISEGNNDIDVISYNLLIYPTINGSASGASFPYSGSMTSSKDDL